MRRKRLSTYPGGVWRYVPDAKAATKSTENNVYMTDQIFSSQDSPQHARAMPQGRHNPKDYRPYEYGKSKPHLRPTILPVHAGFVRKSGEEGISTLCGDDGVTDNDLVDCPMCLRIMHFRGFARRTA